jgi:hypothetical protein
VPATPRTSGTSGARFATASGLPLAPMSPPPAEGTPHPRPRPTHQRGGASAGTQVIDDPDNGSRPSEGYTAVAAAPNTAVAEPGLDALAQNTAVAEPGLAPNTALLGDQTPVVGAGASDVPGEQTVFDLEYFRHLEITGSYKQHNVAMKWHRQEAESAGLDSLTFDNTAPNPVATIVHGQGTSFHFEGDPSIPWRWQEMVAQMDDHSMQMVAQGLGAQSRSRGLVSCRLQKTGRYDHKRHHALGQAASGEMLCIWDFAFVREDDTQLFIHPNYSTTKIECYRVEPHTGP